MSVIRSSIILGASLMLTGCTGLTLGENEAGGDTWLETEVPHTNPGEIAHGTGSIAVDHRDETAYVMQVTSDHTEGETPIVSKDLYAADPDDGSVQHVGDFSDSDDMRILFPKGGVMVMGEEGGVDTLSLFDADDHSLVIQDTRTVRYNGTRMSPSREWVAVADNTNTLSPIHIINGQTLDTTIIPHDGDWLEAMWMNESDELIAIVFYDWLGEEPYARILSWQMNDVVDSGFETAGGLWAEPRLDITVQGVTGDFWFSFSWVGISPDDERAVFPVLTDTEAGWRHDLIVMDIETGDVDTIENAKGPVGFTPDGQTIVSYTNAGDGDQDLLLIDALTLEKDDQPVSIAGGLSYFVTHEGNFVVVAANDAEQQLVLYDIDQEEQTKMDGPGIGLNEFVSRIGHGEMWLVDDQALYRLDFYEGDLETVPTDFTPEHINILPGRDMLVLDDVKGTELSFFSPITRQVDIKAELPQD